MSLPSRGPSRPNTVVIILGSAILIALIVLIGILLRGNPQSTNPTPTGGVSEGSSTTSGEIAKHNPPPKPKPIDQPARIRETAREGATYRTIVKAGFTARSEDKDWGVTAVITSIFEAEFVVNRTVEKNDGRVIVERRHFEEARAVKVLCEAESVQLDLGVPTATILAGLGLYDPGIAIVAHIFSQIVEEGTQSAVSAEIQNTAKAFTQLESIEGKTVRITYEDGLGITGIEPVGCSLTTEEMDYLAGISTLCDYYILPDLETEVGQTWDVEAQHLSVMLDPSWNARPTGMVTMRRVADELVDDKPIARLQIHKGTMNLVADDGSRRRVGTLVPRGNMEFDLSGGFLRLAALTGSMAFEEVSKDHLLFEARFRTEPKIQISYSCELK